MVEGRKMPTSPSISKEQLAGMIDHTLLKPEASKNDILKLCIEAKKYNFASVCVNPAYVNLAADTLNGTNVKVGSVIAFPFGATPSMVKAFETENAACNGAEEFDMVINIGALKTKDYQLVSNDIASVVKAAKKNNRNSIVKVILETGLLTLEEKVIACKIAKEADADFVKTSTGFIAGGATIEDVRLLRNAVGSHLGVKASGGIRTLEKALSMIEAGANRIGTSSGVAIIESLER